MQEYPQLIVIGQIFVQEEILSQVGRNSEYVHEESDSCLLEKKNEEEKTIYIGDSVLLPEKTSRLRYCITHNGLPGSKPYRSNAGGIQCDAFESYGRHKQQGRIRLSAKEQRSLTQLY